MMNEGCRSDNDKFDNDISKFPVKPHVFRNAYTFTNGFCPNAKKCYYFFTFSYYLIHSYITEATNKQLHKYYVSNSMLK